MAPHQFGRRRALAAVAAGACVVPASVLGLGLGSDHFRSALAAGSVVLFALLTGLACHWRGTQAPDDESEQQIWKFFRAAMGFWAFSQFLQLGSVLLPINSSGRSTLQNLGWLMILVALVPFVGGIGAVMMRDYARQPGALIRAVLDATVVGWAFFLTLWVAVIGPAIAAQRVATADALVPLLWLGTVSLLAALMLYLVAGMSNSGLRPLVPWWGTLGLVVTTGVTDAYVVYATLSGTYRTGTPFDAGWPIGATLFLCAALVPPPDAKIPMPRRVRGFGASVPDGFIVVAALVSAVTPEITGFKDDITNWIRTVLLLLVVVHQILVRRENRALNEILQARVVAGTVRIESNNKRFRALVENSSDVIGLMDKDGVLSYISDSARRVLGVPAESLVGLEISAYLDQDSTRAMYAAMAKVSREPMSREIIELRLTMPDGRELVMEEVLTNMLDDPAVQAYVLNTRDITERRKLEDDLVHQAFHDSLTGLANRALFNDRVAHALQRTPPPGQTELIGVLFLDLNGFKAVNDTLGHPAGDALLVVVSRRLAGCLRPGDTIARLGGDEFAVLVEGASSEADFVQLARHLHAALEPAIDLDGQEVFVGTAIGIASAEVGSIDVDQLVRNADLAMYQAKERRDGRPAVYDPSLHHELLDRMTLESDLRRALIDQELEVHYQPTYMLDSGELVGVEALVRWPHPERGMVPPDVFVPIAEQTGMIHELGRFVLSQACAQGQEWAELSPFVDLTVSVNVSVKQLQRREFVAEVQETLRESGFPPQRLVLEMTESILVSDTETILRTLRAFKEMGVRIAIDDFGTGYSSLSYLHNFPVDILKIDRSFVERLSGTGAEESLVETIVHLGRTLKLETIAEGIEQPEQIHALRRLGCEQAQGYHFGRPGPAETVTQLMLATAARREAQADAAVPRHPA
ncbi:EAL domain-containing protein [Kineosporia babensis]|uniref:EAL domain-containing protein n=1 Tax=Kineosporia babensis TaxID=499548 RepID=A0A9X1NK62_9ACTN|nr:EAL domain-containing protein [Kineosporia babensis]MCD5315575.1 EAL domain-containing protein [Kineosporia babensis]